MNRFMLAFASSMNESDRRALIIVIIVVLILFLLLGLIGMGIRWVIQKQSQIADEMMYDVTVTRVVTDPKVYRSLAFRKSNRRLIQEGWIPLLIILAGIISWLVSFGVRDCWGQASIFGEFGELFFQWDFGAEGVTTKVFGVTILANWPPLKEGFPRFEVVHIGSYLSCLAWIIGGAWFFIVCQGYFARFFTILSRSHSIFNRSLKDFKANEMDAEAFKNEQSLEDKKRAEQRKGDPNLPTT